MLHNANFYVLTGGPGAGKTSVLTALSARGYKCVPESGRAVIKDEVRLGGTALPWADKAAFALRMEEMDRQSHEEASTVLPQPLFFDRGLPDVLGYLSLEGLTVPDSLRRACDERRYANVVFIAPPWEAIYTRDAERKQDFAEAQRTFVMMAQTYADLGYRLIELPLGSVEMRAAFILSHVSRSAIRE